MATELEDFHHEFFQDVQVAAEAHEQFVEDSFFDLFCREIIDAGELDTADRAYLLGQRGLRVDGYGGDPLQAEGTLCLIICDFNQSAEIATLTASEMDAIFKRLSNFLEKSLDQDFRDGLDPSSPAFGLADLIASRWPTISKVRLLLISNRVLSSRVDGRAAGTYQHVELTYNVWDLQRLHRFVTSGHGREDIEVDLETDFGGHPFLGLPAHVDGAAYQAYLAVVPASQLAEIYDLWGARLLEQNVRSFLQARGKVMKTSAIPEIGYQGMLVEIPIASAQEVIDHPETSLASDGRMMFLRPTGQATSDAIGVELVEEAPRDTEELGETTPLIALLDGLPLANHFLLRDRLLIDDPDGWAGRYAAGQQLHGTAMASLLTHGDLNDVEQTVSTRPLYVRPLMTPNPMRLNSAETIPDDELAVDLVHRAVRRIVEGDGSEPAAAPTVRIISYSIGSVWRKFDRQVGSLARLLDWLAWKYNLLFVVSAGNCVDALHTDLPDAGGPLSASDELRRAVIRAVWRDSRNRRLLEPSEAINALSVGATFDDASGAAPPGVLVLFDGDQYPSPISPLGLGFRRAVKPEIVAPGGRTALRRRLVPHSETLVLTPSVDGHAPGQKVAAPGPIAGDLKFTTHRCGTSNSTALTARAAGMVYDTISESGGDGLAVPEEFCPVAVKTLLVHSASWPDAQGFVEESIADLIGPGRNKRQQIARFFGYGVLQPARARASSDQCATLLGWGELGADEADVFSLPLPASLSTLAIWRRLTFTLAWFSPTHPPDRRYRQASLWVEPLEGDPLGVTRQEADYHLARRGTVQHEVLEGTNATGYADDAILNFRVNCRSDAGTLTERVRYAFAVSLEVAEDIPIYAEILARVRPTVRVAPAAL